MQVTFAWMTKVKLQKKIKKLFLVRTLGSRPLGHLEMVLGLS
jgi:hypothetical protein